MKENLSKYWPFWGLHFGLHIIIGLIAAIAGLVVILVVREFFYGLALIGAGMFALLNGWQGAKELVTSILSVIVPCGLTLNLVSPLTSNVLVGEVVFIPT